MLALPGAAAAQDGYRGTLLQSDQINSFKGKCAALRAASTASLSTPAAAGIDRTETGSIKATSPAADSDPAARANWLRAQASVTLAECDAAGFRE